VGHAAGPATPFRPVATVAARRLRPL